MIKVLFFAQLREKLNCSQLEIPFTKSPGDSFTVAELKTELAQRGEAWQSVFTNKQVLSAVNQLISDNETTLSDGDEVAFFPPVTGG